MKAVTTVPVAAFGMIAGPAGIEHGIGAGHPLGHAGRAGGRAPQQRYDDGRSHQPDGRPVHQAPD